MKLTIRWPKRALDLWPFDSGQTAMLMTAASLFLLAAIIYAISETGG